VLRSCPGAARTEAPTWSFKLIENVKLDTGIVYQNVYYVAIHNSAVLHGKYDTAKRTTHHAVFEEGPFCDRRIAAITTYSSPDGVKPGCVAHEIYDDTCLQCKDIYQITSADGPPMERNPINVQKEIETASRSWGMGGIKLSDYVTDAAQMATIIARLNELGVNTNDALNWDNASGKLTPRAFWRLAQVPILILPTGDENRWETHVPLVEYLIMMLMVDGARYVMAGFRPTKYLIKGDRPAGVDYTNLSVEVHPMESRVRLSNSRTL
jgi:hypothetical protein